MRVLDLESTIDWMAARRLVLRPAAAWGQDHRLELPTTFHRLWFATPSEARRQHALTHLLSKWLQPQSSLLAVNVVALFKDYELDALLWLREAFGETRWVDGVPGGNTPGHLFPDNSREAGREVREVISLLLAYTFEGYLVEADGRTLVWFADEVIDVYCGDVGRMAGLRQVIETLRLTVYGTSEPGQ